MKEKKYETQENNIQNNNNNNKQAKKRKNKFLALNCVFGSVMLLGCVGTITFGSLWCQQRKMNPQPIPQTTHTVTFDLDGGNIQGVVDSKLVVVQNSTYGVLPTPIKTSYKFLNWQVNGQNVSPTDIITNDVTVKAIWEYDAPSIVIPLELTTWNSGETVEEPHPVLYQTSGLGVLSSVTYRVKIDFSKIPSEVKQGKEFIGFGMGVTVGDLSEWGKEESIAVLMDYKAKFVVDNVEMPTDSYYFLPTAYYDAVGMHYVVENPEVMPETFNKDTSILTFDLTPSKQIDEQVTFVFFPWFV